MPEGIFVCKSTKGEDGKGQIKCFSVGEIDKMLGSMPKCPIKGE